MIMKRLQIRYTKDNDEELGHIARYLGESKPAQDAVRLYDDIEELKNLMSDGMCHFIFRKVNGERRDAYGTRASDIIDRYEDKGKAPSGRKSAFNGTFSCFDLVRRDWRCFRVDTLVELDRDYVI